MSDEAEEVPEDVQAVALLQFNLLLSLEKSARSGNGEMMERFVEDHWSMHDRSESISNSTLKPNMPEM